METLQDFKIELVIAPDGVLEKHVYVNGIIQYIFTIEGVFQRRDKSLHFVLDGFK